MDYLLVAAVSAYLIAAVFFAVQRLQVLEDIRESIDDALIAHLEEQECGHFCEGPIDCRNIRNGRFE